MLQLNSRCHVKTVKSEQTGFVRVLEILESPGILFRHFPGLESPGKLMQVLESPGIYAGICSRTGTS